MMTKKLVLVSNPFYAWIECGEQGWEAEQIQKIGSDALFDDLCVVAPVDNERELGKLRDLLYAKTDNLFSAQVIESYVPFGDPPEGFENNTVNEIVQTQVLTVDEVNGKLPDVVIINGHRYVLDGE